MYYVRLLYNSPGVASIDLFCFYFMPFWTLKTKKKLPPPPHFKGSNYHFISSNSKFLHWNLFDWLWRHQQKALVSVIPSSVWKRIKMREKQVNGDYSRDDIISVSTLSRAYHLTHLSNTYLITAVFGLCL